MASLKGEKHSIANVKRRPIGRIFLTLWPVTIEADVSVSLYFMAPDIGVRTEAN